LKELGTKGGARENAGQEAPVDNVPAKNPRGERTITHADKPSSVLWGESRCAVGDDSRKLAREIKGGGDIMRRYQGRPQNLLSHQLERKRSGKDEEGKYIIWGPSKERQRDLEKAMSCIPLHKISKKNRGGDLDGHPDQKRSVVESGKYS